MHNSMENFTICYEKKVYTTMVNNSINIKKMNNHLSSQTIEQKKEHNIWH